MRRLDVRLVKRRKSDIDKTLISKVKRISKIRKGSKFSRFFKYIFENKKIKRLLGTNLAFLVMASSFLPNQVSNQIDYNEEVQEVTSLPLVTQTQKGIQAPLKKIRLTQKYSFFHPGIDLDGETGDSVYPIMPGIVQLTGYSRFGYGNSILINHGGGITSLYAHLSKIEVEQGQKVTHETKIGEMGATGRSFGDHLHLEVREDGVSINPLFVLEE